jgi:glycine cleavage system H protein
MLGAKPVKETNKVSAKEVKSDRKYTKEHEWALTTDGKLMVGITAFAVDQLGDVTLVNLDVAPGDRVEQGAPFGTIESVKTLSDLFAPVAGEVLEVNPALETSPEIINQDCWGAGWMITIKPDAPAHVDALLDGSAYLEFIEESNH